MVENEFTQMKKSDRSDFKQEEEPKIFSTENLKGYWKVIITLFSVILLYYIIQLLIMGPNRDGMPGAQDGGLPPIFTAIDNIDFKTASSNTSQNLSIIVQYNSNLTQIPPSGDLPLGGDGMVHPMADSWPIWGTLSFPTIVEIIYASGIFFAFFLGINYIIKKNTKKDAKNEKFSEELDKSDKYENSEKLMKKRKSIWIKLVLSLIGVTLIILTNFIQGWVIGIERPIGGETEIYSDAIKVTNIIDFIRNYETIQASLSVHAQTQPPGAVLFIYLLYLVFQSPAAISIALCTISGLMSAFFIDNIFTKLFDSSSGKYTLFLYLLLPAVQVYYLANIYAIVASLLLGVFYFYLKENKIISIVGSSIFVFLALITSFLSIWVLLFLFLYEFLRIIDRKIFNISKVKELGLSKWLKEIIYPYTKLIIIISIMVVSYVFLLVFLNFDYISAFKFASSLENPDGFMLFANPYQYFVTRIQGILDILIFIGPVLILFMYNGFKLMKSDINDNADSGFKEKYFIFVAAILSLLILFLTGAPKKGETARICMFILPYVLIPCISYLNELGYSKNQKLKLLLIVFLQTIIMQTIGIYVW